MMHFSDFGFDENPFAITPDPRYLYLSRGHEESLAHLIYGAGPNGGFVLLTGEVGTGKTMMIRSLLEQKLDHVDFALIYNPRLSPVEFLAAICDELGIGYDAERTGVKSLSDRLNHHLLVAHTAGRNTLLVVDEAQNLSAGLLEQIRLLTNLETSTQKLLKIILVGQPELNDLLARNDMRQVDQRITARYHLKPLSASETRVYIRHRLSVAGIHESIFSAAALRLIHRLTGGVPRKINTLCERTLLALFTKGRHDVNVWLVWLAYRDIRGEAKGAKARRGAGLVISITVILVMALLIGYWISTDPEQPPSIVAQPSVPSRSKDQSEVMRIERNAPQDTDQSPAKEPVLDEHGLFSSLLELWDVHDHPATEEDLCTTELPAGLQCLIVATDWSGLVKLNHPALLYLGSVDSNQAMLLKKVEGSRALVLDADGEGWRETVDLKTQWNGRIVVLWRSITTMPLLGASSSGSAVTRLREAFARLDGELPPRVIGEDWFDDSLAERVRAFQIQEGLGVDGVAGPRTQIILGNQLNQSDVPHLLDEGR